MQDFHAIKFLSLSFSSSFLLPGCTEQTEPAWKKFTKEQLDAIEKARSEVAAKGELVMEAKGG